MIRGSHLVIWTLVMTAWYQTQLSSAPLSSSGSARPQTRLRPESVNYLLVIIWVIHSITPEIVDMVTTLRDFLSHYPSISKDRVTWSLYTTCRVLFLVSSFIAASNCSALLWIWSCRRLQICSVQSPVSRCLRSLQRDIPAVTALAPRVPLLYWCTLTGQGRRPALYTHCTSLNASFPLVMPMKVCEPHMHAVFFWKLFNLIPV